MSSPISALKEAIRLKLSGDAALLAIIRAPKIYSESPRHPVYPYLAFLAAEARENGTSSDEGHVVELTLCVFTRGAGSQPGAEAAEAGRRALAAMPADIGGHRLVNLTVRSVEPAAQKDGETWRTLIRIRAVTEVL